MKSTIAAEEWGLPPLPAKLPSGNYPAVEYARALAARELILSRRRIGLAQSELARRAGVRVETLNRDRTGQNDVKPDRDGKAGRSVECPAFAAEPDMKPLGKIPATGFEPVTSGLGNQRSIQLSYAGADSNAIAAFERKQVEDSRGSQLRTGGTRSWKATRPSPIDPGVSFLGVHTCTSPRLDGRALELSQSKAD